MSKVVSYLSIILILVLYTANCSTLTAQSTADVEKLDTYFTKLTANNKFMGSVTLLNGPDVVFSKAYGFTTEAQQPAKPDTKYRIGSITKSFTAALILQLVEKGQISLSDKLENFYPQIPNAEHITIEQLLRHQSGLVNFTNEEEYGEYHTEGRSKEELLELFIEYGTNFEPGEQFEYSNTAYVLLGYIIEDVTGMSYADALQEMIAEPLGLEQTYFGSGLHTDRGEAASFSYRSGWVKATNTDMAIPHGAGAIVSTSEETARFMRALLNGDLISEESLEQMTRLEHNFGLGIFSIPFHDKRAYGHTGGIDGFTSVAAHFPGEDFTFAVASNGMNYLANEIYVGLLSIAFGEEFDIPDFKEVEEIFLTEEEMIAYTGTYSTDQMPLQIRLFIENGELMAQATGQGAFPLTIVDETTMRFDPAGLVIEFENPENFNFTQFTLIQAGQQIRFEKNGE